MIVRDCGLGRDRLEMADCRAAAILTDAGFAIAVVEQQGQRIQIYAAGDPDEARFLDKCQQLGVTPASSAPLQMTRSRSRG